MRRRIAIMLTVLATSMGTVAVTADMAQARQDTNWPCPSC